MDNLQWHVGDVTITRVVEMLAPVPPEGLLPGATAEGIERNLSWLKPNFIDDDGNLVLSIHALCVESQGRKIVVDTCVGNDRVIPEFDGLTLDTPFLDDLAAAGFAREDVDTVVCTHLHFDHVGWNTMLVDGKWVPTFPNARYVICRGEWEHWSTVGGTGYAATLNDAVRPVVDAGLVDFVEPNHQVTAEIRLEPTPGHTPGHVGVHIVSGGRHAFITGDLAHHPVQWAQPSWAAAPDTDPAQSTATRQRLLAEFADTDVLVIGTHFAPPCSGHLVSDGDGYRFDASSA
jgi:glyoxylase-like metal-dependent hydrolase (beta-lactamase superfamily II)